MSWITAALVAPLLWSLANIFDAKVSREHIRNPVVLTMYTGFFGLLGFVIVPFAGFEILNGRGMVLSLLSGALYIYATIPYFKAISEEEASRVMTLWHLSKALMPLIAFVFIGEHLGNMQYLAFGMIMVGTFIISIKKEEKKFRLSNALYWALLAGIAFQVYYLLQKPLYEEYKFLEVFLWVRMGSVLGALTLMLTPYGGKFFASLKNLKAKPAAMIFASESLNLLGIGFVTYALAYGAVSLVLAINSLQGVYVFVIATISSFFFPKIYREETGTGVWLLKICAIAIMTASMIILKLP